MTTPSFEIALDRPDSAASPLGAIAQVQATQLMPTQFYEQYQKPGIPVLISGLFEADTDWNLDYLCQQLGETEFPIQDHGSSHRARDKRTWTGTGSGVDTIVMPFRQYADLLRSREAHQRDLYMGKCALHQTPLGDTHAFEQLEAHLGLQTPFTPWSFWMGPAGHITHLHYDPMDGTLAQLHGAKRVILFPPSQLYNLYPFSVFNQVRYGMKLRPGHSRVYPDQPEFEQFPRLRAALPHRYEFTLNQGDLLYIPAGWWHEVIAQGDEMSCSVNRFWNVTPLSRALTSWSKWRIHLGSVLALPHLVYALGQALVSGNPAQKIRQLTLKL
ncbi:MAG: cupin-like domain-containing protein [Kaiparowitsia implicata GSE-PSE-MK54-09C]|jgi:lysine-specific demethylase 8/hypoxia-inducible factor 1-alpha inhibitor (HIF hydroxylase)|nr:cupin-like domain-containing protein [Kaiparowitsia implicata GSE-PSE-MK54-09C]